MGHPTTLQRLKNKTLVIPVIPPKRCHCIMLQDFYTNDQRCDCCVNALQLEALKGTYGRQKEEAIQDS